MLKLMLKLKPGQDEEQEKVVVHSCQLQLGNSRSRVPYFHKNADDACNRQSLERIAEQYAHSRTCIKERKHAIYQSSDDREEGQSNTQPNTREKKQGVLTVVKRAIGWTSTKI